MSPSPPNLESITSSASVPAVILSIIAALSLTPLFSSAQSGSPADSAQPSERASMGQAVLPDSSIVDREAALQQAENDLLKKLNGGVSASSGGTADVDGRNSFIIDSEPSAKPQPAVSGAVLSERLSGQEPQKDAPATASAKPSDPTVSPALLNCPPCAIQAPSKPASQRPSGASSRRTPSSASSSSSRVQREDSLFSGRSGSCDQSIDDPYVPTSEKARIIASRTHLRLGPSRTESSLFVLPKDALVSIEGRDGEWYRVMTTTGVRGWVSGQYLIFDVDVPESSSVRVGPYNANYEPTGIRY